MAINFINHLVKILIFIFLLKGLNVAYAVQINPVSFFRDKIITSHDVESRQKLNNSLLSISKENLLSLPLLPKSDNIQEQLKKELIIKRWAKKYGINTTNEEIIKEIYVIFSQYNISYQNLKDKIFNNNANLLEEYKNYMTSYLLWMKIIRKQIVPKIVISHHELKELATINNIKTTTTKIKLYEIYLKDISIKNKAINEIKDLYDFKNFAKKFSQSPISSNGGFLGWINLSDLNKNTANLLNNLKIKTLSQAKEDQDGYYLYMIEQKEIIDFIEPRIKKIIYNALLERKIMAQIKKFFIEGKKQLL